MTAVPANIKVTCEFQDIRGFRAQAVLNLFEADISADSGSVMGIYDLVANYASKLAAISSAKLIRVSYAYDFDYAQEPSSETGDYQLVQQKAHTTWGDGNGGFSHISIPAPAAAIFLTAGMDNLFTVNPAASGITQLQSAVDAFFSTAGYGSPRGVAAFSQFYGGQFKQGKPPIRRVLQGA